MTRTRPRFRALFTAILALVAGARPAAAAPQDEIQAVFDRAVAKAQAGQASESDLARELNDLSDLHKKYRSQRADAAEALLARALIYERIIKDREMALIIYTQIATDYPGTPAGYLAATTVEAAIATADDNPPPRGRAANQRPSASGSSRDSSVASRNPSSGSRGGRGTAGSRSSPGALAGRSGSPPEVGSTFPEFSVQDLDGAPLALEDLRGQMVLVTFWSTSCSECIEEMDNVMAAYRRFHRKGFEIVGISLDRDRAPLKNFVRARTITWPQFFDEGGSFSRRFGITSPGKSFLLDREGKVIAVDLRGYALERMLQKHLEPQI